MIFDPPLIPARLIRRYKRFLADVELGDGRRITAHCPNSGSMRSCLGKGWPAMLSDSGVTTRKYRHTLEMLHNGRCWIGVNTHLANRVVLEALEERRLPGFRGYHSFRREVPYGERSRIDILAEGDSGLCYIEIKNVTLLAEDGCWAFPDAVITRGLKHLRELQSMIEAGHRAVLLFLIQRGDGNGFRSAAEIDPAYAEELARARTRGLEVLPCLARVAPEEVRLEGPVDRTGD